MKKNKGFAITGMLYAILVLFLLLISAVLVLLANRKVILDKVKSEVSATLLGEISSVGFEHDYVYVANNTTIPDFQYDLLDGAFVYNEYGEIIQGSSIEIVNSDFNQSVNGIYLIQYRSVIDGREYYGSRNIEVVDPIVMDFSAYDLIQSYTVMNDGYYKLEVWGAQGGGATGTNGSTRVGGYGSYSKGVSQFKENDIVYVAVGGQGLTGTSTGTQLGGYNGGGNGLYHGGSGGGATHISTSRKLLSELSESKDSVLIVAGGGGGAAVTNDANCSDGGHAGGYIGNSANVNACTDTLGSNGYGTGGTQYAGGSSSTTGVSGTFGLGAVSTQTNTDYGTGGGGGGLYGGGASSIAGAGGGSGYVGNSRLISYGAIQKGMYCYECQTSDLVDTFTSSISVSSDVATMGTAKTGSGYARITTLVLYEDPTPQPELAVEFDFYKYIIMNGYAGTVDYERGITVKNESGNTVSADVSYVLPSNFSVSTNGTYDIHYVVSDGNYIGVGTRTVVVQDKVSQPFAYTGGAQTYSIPDDGIYQLEVWGAQGGTRSTTYGTGGNGGYASGDLYLARATVLNIYVGGAGASADSSTSYVAGGYNGGGSAKYYGGTGGGATDIRIGGTTLYDRLIVAGGGGGAQGRGSSTYKGNGGSGGGTSGANGTYYNGSSTAYYGGGATQTAGGTTYSGTSSYMGTAGAFGTGGNGGYYSTSYYGTGGGGGGWYGGGGGYYRYAGGGGGSGFVWSSDTASNVPDGYLVSTDYYLSNTTLTSGVNTGNGSASVTPLLLYAVQPLKIEFSFTKFIVSNGYTGTIDYKKGITVKNRDGKTVSAEITYDIPDDFSTTVNGTYTITYTAKYGDDIGYGTRTIVVQDVPATTFAYTGDVQTYSIPANGLYQLEVWGAQGGTRSTTYGTGGNGGYASGQITLSKGKSLNIYVGGKGASAGSSTSYVAGGYNGGGSAKYYGGTGGGATDIRIGGTTLYDRLIVAGGGGGAQGRGSSTYKGNGGSGGGTSGANGTYYNGSSTAYYGGGATQTAGGTTYSGTSSYMGTAGAFGTGGNGGYYSTSYYGTGGGGGGWYGGGGGYYCYAGGGGGSGFVWSAATKGNVPSGYLVSTSYYLTNTVLTAGNASMPTQDGTGTMTGNSGNGFAKVTPLLQYVN